ncbi:hypothetical protein HanXRQr2_Chr14g0664881 [Helianthus annuus]|uniref:Uncharacterized protein n=1 Tax=Helianthus annuus TaxID=4232 RepID=A0A9K3ED30_HELAN|nr:hypothetical protein HanXRQr2_Chr14g0664881 [Helianthus annuus]KAJ0842122.1 hypothetical protein HanPSC8_Chr14g0638121 [Helianthus annuus]
MKALGIMWTWTQARKTNGSRGDKEANAKMDAQGCAGHGGSSRNKDRRTSHIRDCTGLSKDANCCT